MEKTISILKILLCLELIVVAMFIYKGSTMDLTHLLICILIMIPSYLIDNLEQSIKEYQEKMTTFFDSHLEIVNSMAKTNQQTQSEILEQIKSLKVCIDNK